MTLATPTDVGDAQRPPKVRRRPSASRSVFDPTIVRSAFVGAVRKLDPRIMARNPVMFIVEIGSVLTTILFVRDLGSGTAQENAFAGLVAAWLWLTVLFANFAEAMAEGRQTRSPVPCPSRGRGRTGSS